MGALSRARAQAAGWLETTPEVSLVCEIAADYVAALRQRRGRIEAWATRSLPSGAIRPGPLTDNLADSAAVQDAVKAVLGAVAAGHRRCILIVPDLLARVVLLDFDRIPERADQAEALLRWRLAKDLPFDVSQSTISHQTQPGKNGNQEVLVAVCQQGLVHQYEERLESLGLDVGWVVLSTLATLGWLGAESERPRLLIKGSPDSMGLSVLHAGSVRFFRSVLATGAWTVDRLFEKSYPALVYFQDKWGESVADALVCGLGAQGAELATRLQREAGCSVRVPDLGAQELPPSTLSGGAADERLVPSLGWIKAEHP